LGASLKYDGTRTLIVGALLAAVYFLGLPNFWPEPTATADLAADLSIGSDLPLTVTVKAWHPNISVRQVSFAVDNLQSTALLSRKADVPLNVHDRDRDTSWNVGLTKRMSRPTTKTLSLTVPLAEMARKRGFRMGELRGTIDVVIDYTKVSSQADYPALTAKHSIPFEIKLH
jgi:hypothetical protein